MNRDLIIEPSSNTTYCYHTTIERDKLSDPLVFSKVWTSVTINPIHNSTDTYNKKHITTYYQSYNTNSYNLTLTLRPYDFVFYSYPDTSADWLIYIDKLAQYSNYEGAINLTYNNTKITDVFITMEPINITESMCTCMYDLNTDTRFKPTINMRINTTNTSTINYLAFN